MNAWVALGGLVVVVLIIVIFTTRLKCDWFKIDCGGGGGTPSPGLPSSSCKVISDDPFRLSFPTLKREGDSCIFDKIPYEPSPPIDRVMSVLGHVPPNPNMSPSRPLPRDEKVALEVIKSAGGGLALESTVTATGEPAQTRTMPADSYAEGPDCSAPLIATTGDCPTFYNPQCWDPNSNQWSGECDETDNCTPPFVCGNNLPEDDINKCTANNCRYGPTHLSIDDVRGSTIEVTNISDEPDGTAVCC